MNQLRMNLQLLTANFLFFHCRGREDHCHKRREDRQVGRGDEHSEGKEHDHHKYRLWRWWQRPRSLFNEAQPYLEEPRPYAMP